MSCYQSKFPALRIVSYAVCRDGIGHVLCLGEEALDRDDAKKSST